MLPATTPRIGILVVAYNAASTLAHVLDRIPVELRQHLHEVLVVGRAVVPSGAAETVSQNGASATRLWLGRLPGDPRGREPLEGKLSQETYVRVWAPVLDADR